jgi:ParB/RepB/Spo0J family partition protein
LAITRRLAESHLAEWERSVHVANTRETGTERTTTVTMERADDGSSLLVREVPVCRIRPEEGLGRKRDRDGHRELQRSIEQFGVLTPITVRLAPDGSGDYLLIKGQGRTLACRLLGIEKIPAIVVDDRYGENEKVKQFLVENVARLKMHPVDRALLIQRARQAGEETVDIARRFGVSAATVRRLLAQLDGASSSEVATLRAGEVSLATHAVVARHVLPAERAAVIKAIAGTALKAKELEALLVAIGWGALTALGPGSRDKRLNLLSWVCSVFEQLPPGTTNERLHQLAIKLPIAFETQRPSRVRVAR